MTESLEIPTHTEGFSTQEWRTRCDTAATYRLQAKYRMTDLTGGFIGGRIIGEDRFAIKPAHQFAEEVRASDLVIANLDHEVLGNGVPNDAGLHTCASVFSARPELHGLVHVHSRASAAVATLECGLQPLCQAAFMFYDRIGYADFDYDLNRETCHLLVEALGSHKAVLMRHHGMLTTGRTLGEAFFLAYFLNQACDIQLSMMMSGEKFHELCTEQIEDIVRKQDESELYGYDGSDEWAGWVRMLEREGADYRS